MSRTHKKAWAVAVGAVVAGIVVLWTLQPLFQANQPSQVALVDDPSSGCAVGGTITHELSGNTLTIEPDAYLALLEVEVNTQVVAVPSGAIGTAYTVRVFQYTPTEEYSKYFGKGFVLYFYSWDGEEWIADGSNVFSFYEPAENGTMDMKALIVLAGSGEGLALNGAGGHVVAALEPKDPSAALAARYSVNLEIACSQPGVMTV